MRELSVERIAFSLGRTVIREVTFWLQIFSDCRELYAAQKYFKYDGKTRRRNYQPYNEHLLQFIIFRNCQIEVLQPINSGKRNI